MSHTSAASSRSIVHGEEDDLVAQSRTLLTAGGECTGVATMSWGRWQVAAAVLSACGLAGFGAGFMASSSRSHHGNSLRHAGAEDVALQAAGASCSSLGCGVRGAIAAGCQCHESCVVEGNCCDDRQAVCREASGWVFVGNGYCGSTAMGIADMQTASSATDCQAACDGREGCNKITFDASLGSCFLGGPHADMGECDQNTNGVTYWK
eukprot:TRINITY_DN7796_c0_g1_i1.p1 TRINITY_DN7796_c0_g1~~TRINITY_DN7796_c0_g1_i1.p1  ORF type:complete len:208 (+),score=33.69 TRINITY_DN7796_c0_g1_i1:66-689(+)